MSTYLLLLPLLTLPLAGWVLYRLPDWEAGRDWAAIQANGSEDSLKEVFHFWRGVRRGTLQGGIAGLAPLPLLTVGFWPYALTVAALAVAAGAWFVYRFNPRLSELRGLPPYYVSLDARAAYFPDRYLAAKANRLCPDTWYLTVGELLQLRQAVAGPLLQKLLRRILTIGLAAAALLAAAAVTLAVT